MFAAGVPLVEAMGSVAGATGNIVYEEGTLRIRSARTALRYLGAGRALADNRGFVDTGDMVERRGDRYYFLGRREGVINVGGQKVYPEEVEAVLNTHPSVVRSAVIGRVVEGTQGGEEIVAYVQLAPSSTTSESELVHHAALHLVPYKRPSQILLVTSMPLTPTGKIVKGELAKVAQFVPTC